MDEILDVVIMGAGLSGIGAAYHVQNKCPDYRYAVLEARTGMGGTWDLFRYPGVRSDSDMHTLGYPFRPWNDDRSVADGPSILKYIQETAAEYGIDKRIRFAHTLVGADWSTAEGMWTLSVERTDNGEWLTLKCRFLVACGGYYDYEKGYTPYYPGLTDFRGKFIHPQQWDETIDYTDQRVIVIGSGATAATLVPELAKRAKHVIMLQRSPSYFAPLPSIDKTAKLIKKIFPYRLAHTIVRWKNILIGMALFWFCRRLPGLARRALLAGVKRGVHGSADRMADFSPRYDPWTQRVCFIPSGDFFKAVNAGKADVVTDSIEKFTASGIRLQSGKEIPADIVVTATGLTLKFLGGVSLRIDGRAIKIPDLVSYKGAMLSGVPNLVMTFGYVSASWTLKCDLISEWLGRMLQYMETNGLKTVTPDANPEIERMALIDFSSGYFQRAKGVLPQQGTRAPWKLSQNYFSDLIAFRAKPVKDEGLKFS